MTFTSGFVSGTGWHAWVRLRPQLGDWTWEAVSVGASTCWQPAPTEEAAQAAALAWVRERAEDVAQRAAAVIEELGRAGAGHAPLRKAGVKGDGDGVD